MTSWTRQNGKFKSFLSKLYSQDSMLRQCFKSDLTSYDIISAHFRRTCNETSYYVRARPTPPLIVLVTLGRFVVISLRNTRTAVVVVGVTWALTRKRKRRENVKTGMWKWDVSGRVEPYRRFLPLLCSTRHAFVPVWSTCYCAQLLL